MVLKVVLTSNNIGFGTWKIEQRAWNLRQKDVANFASDFQSAELYSDALHRIGNQESRPTLVPHVNAHYAVIVS